MTKFKKTISSLENFLKYASAKKLWMFFTTLFLTIGAWVINFYVQIPARLPEIRKNTIEIDRAFEDPEKLLEILDSMKRAIEYRISVEEYLNSVINIIKNEESLPSSVISTGLNNIKAARYQYAITIGILQGTQFHDERFNDYSEGFAHDLNESQIYFDEVEKFFTAKAWRDKEGVDKFIEEYEKNLCDILESNCQKMMARARSFEQEIDAYLVEHESEILSARAKNNLYFIQLALTLPAIIYEFVFVVVGVNAWRNFQYRSEVRLKRTKSPGKNRAKK